MSAEKNWQFELEEYIKQGEPGQIEKSEAWQTAIGLQAVDGLKTSAYLLDTAKEHIEGKISIDEAQKRIQSYYEQRTDRTEVENNTKEADIVSARIAKLLGEKAFQFSPAEWLTIHRRLFEGVFTHAGQIRQYNITKKEWVLKGDTVTYAAWNSIKDTLDYDFATEKQYSYEGLSVERCVKHLCPLGAFYALFNKVSLFGMKVDEHKCVSCGKCAKVCKMDVDVTKTPNSTECIRCGKCISACPTDAVSFQYGFGMLGKTVDENAKIENKTNKKETKEEL